MTQSALGLAHLPEARATQGEAERLIKAGVLERSNSPYSSSIVFVPKPPKKVPDGKGGFILKPAWRLTVDVAG